jgi:alpha-amylase/alpha-mannosidase (GH57 family)
LQLFVKGIMQPVSVAFFWHQHQPYYPDDVSGETLMPWVRLHGTKDYIGMALHLKEVPEFHCTINLVPSLISQLQRYTDRGGSDRHLDLSRMPADGLAEDDLHDLLDNFFMASVDTMVRPHARYFDLYLRRGFGIDSAEQAAGRFSPRDIRDLQVWSNLTWFHELLFHRDAELREFRKKGRNWSEEEKQWLLDKQAAVLAEIVPLHRELAESGQVELTCTPFYHPILPLLWDKRSAREAMPHCALPRHLESYHEDAKVQIRRGVEFHEQVFGSKPKGMWPSEGSVSQDIIPAIAEAGIEWIAGDEEILSRSTNGWISRDGHGHLNHPSMLYRPWRIENGDARLQMIFRDHAMSDLIGFHYQRSPADHAVGDMIGKLKAIGRACEAQNAGRPAFVPIILDGENCWEYFPDGGVAFLRKLYQSCAVDGEIRPQAVSEHLKDHPATDRISRLFAGSWISHNFAIWIGHHEDNTAWDLLHETRQFLTHHSADATESTKAVQRAWEEMLIAEGSDWFWWFGDDHSSAQDGLFDQLFRRHLQNVYTLLDAPVPAALLRPITRHEHRRIHTRPTGFLRVKVDGRMTYFEWISAGHYESGNERGTMTLVTQGLIRDVYFGFDAERLLLRVDTAGIASQDMKQIDELRLTFLEPAGREVRVTGFRKAAPMATVYCDSKRMVLDGVEAAVGAIFELAVPFAGLELQPDAPAHMYLEAFSSKKSVDRAPREGTLEMVTPTPDFELVMWQA